MDPIYAYLNYEIEFMQDLYAGLIVQDQYGHAISGLCSSWEKTADGLTYRFHLRDDAFFSNGQPITVDDVVYSFQRPINPQNAVVSFVDLLFPIKNAKKIYSGQMSDLNQLGVYAEDEKTIIIQLEHPKPFFIEDLKHTIFSIVPKSIIETHGKKWTMIENIATSGAYIIDEWQKEEFIHLHKNEFYFDKKQVDIGHVTYHFIADSNTALRLFRAGDVDFTNQIPFGKIKWLKENYSNELFFNPMFVNYFYAFNMDKGPFQDKRVREAISLVVDRQSISDKVIQYGYKPLYSIVSPGMDNYTLQALPFEGVSFQERVKKAKYLLAEAGYGPENPLYFEMNYNVSDIHEVIAAALANMISKHLDINVNLVNTDMRVHYQNLYKGDFDMGRSAFTVRYPDPYDYLNYFRSDIHFNFSKYSNPEVDALLTQAYSEIDLQNRRQLLERAERIILQDYAILPLFTYGSYVLVRDHVKGVVRNPTDSFPSRYLSIRH